MPALEQTSGSVAVRRQQMPVTCYLFQEQLIDSYTCGLQNRTPSCGSACNKVTTGTNFLGHLINTTFHSGWKLEIFPKVGDVFEEHLLKTD